MISSDFTSELISESPNDQIQSNKLRSIEEEEIKFTLIRNEINQPQGNMNYIPPRILLKNKSAKQMTSD